MNTTEFLSILRERNVRLWVDNGRLKCDAPAGTLDDRLRVQLAARKAELLDLLADAQTTVGAPRSLVPLKPTGEYPPLFARPGHNGDVFCYRALAQYFDPLRPLYGVEPKGLDGSPTGKTIEEMAEYEVDQIRTFQPDGPYYLAGYCAGGAIAFESARQIAQAGGKVARVILFATPFPSVFRAPRVVIHARSLNLRVKRHAPALATGSAADRVEHVRGLFRERLAAAAERREPSLANRRRMEAATVAALKRYEPQFYDGRVDVFHPSEAWRRSGERPDEWKRVAGDIVEYIGPDETEAENMLKEPHIRVFASLLNPSLHDETRRHAADRSD